MVMGHHQTWVGSVSGARPPDYFGISPDDSDALVALIARRPRVVAYAAGHTHRNRVRRVAASKASLASRNAARAVSGSRW